MPLMSPFAISRRSTKMPGAPSSTSSGQAGNWLWPGLGP
jgi:hypothetical protein